MIPNISRTADQKVKVEVVRVLDRIVRAWHVSAMLSQSRQAGQNSLSGRQHNGYDYTLCGHHECREARRVIERQGETTRTMNKEETGEGGVAERGLESLRRSMVEEDCALDEGRCGELAGRLGALLEVLKGERCECEQAGTTVSAIQG